MSRFNCLSLNVRKKNRGTEIAFILASHPTDPSLIPRALGLIPSVPENFSLEFFDVAGIY